MAGRFFQEISAFDASSRMCRHGLQVQPGSGLVPKAIPVLFPGLPLPDCKRLIVLAPITEIAEDLRLPQRVWQLASPGRVKVLYMARAEDYPSEMTARRHLSLLADVTRDKRVPVNIQMVSGLSWLAALRDIAQPGDIILSFSGQRVRKGVFGSEALCGQLGRCLSVPTYLLSGYDETHPKKASSLLRLTLAWGLLGLILAGFFALDAQVISQFTGTLQQVMLLLLICVEIGAIWSWNGLVG